MAQLETHGCLDFMSPPDQRDPVYALDSLWGEACGKMFGVALCRDGKGNPVVLNAFSGQFQGRWKAPGWVPPLFDVSAWSRLVEPVDREIKVLELELSASALGEPARRNLQGRRKALSQGLMRDIHDLYKFENFAGQRRGLGEVFLETGIPNGTGDCCAPKLLVAAVRQRLRPLGIAEFFWGRENASKTRCHREFYPCCPEKCQPLLGFLLCGL